MKAEALGERLECLPAVLSDRDLLKGRGIGNELGFYIFAYAPEHDGVVSAYLPRLTEALKARGVTPRVFNLYELMIAEITSKGLLEEVFKLERTKGAARLESALRKFIHAERLASLIAAGLTEPHDLILLTGIGATYPLIRSHRVLNNLHALTDRVPLVLFFPGAYTGQELRLFNRLKDDNYYRAFPLLEGAKDA